MESRAKAGTGNITKSLKGLTFSLFRGFLPLPVTSSLRLYEATKISDKEHLAQPPESLISLMCTDSTDPIPTSSGVDGVAGSVLSVVLIV